MEIIADAMVTRVERAPGAQQLVAEAPSTSQPGPPGATMTSAPAPPADPYRKAVHVKLAGNQSKARRSLLPPRCAQRYSLLAVLKLKCYLACCCSACLPRSRCQLSAGFAVKQGLLQAFPLEYWAFFCVSS